MEFTLEQVDEVRERTGVSYGEAKEALLETDGDVLEAIILIESNHKKKIKSNISNRGNEVFEKLKEFVKKGNVTRIILKKNGETIMNIPVTAGTVGALIFPPATVTGILVALATGCRLEIVKEDGEIIDINDITEDALINVKDKVEEAKDKFTKRNKTDKMDAE
ncbi:DUF4342 domain-containing protein [Paramaledivibacter caminithermalis]|jgi:translation elongation factor EF-Ts|uniref:DUF4342 domain-containing protein n=1 Tax=Paramaledivibacter caminithermalis (strain DSM 15212 / CIP 107654 / DViRD3) TaxID=1121301 RepID=A0A1M6M7T0_PARC5|nr:DUF4342 domain-containing protein [Paramaledivibacter caminithermalis]SHJ79499.1 protein of unknown function [Paramaledivibacter caminithermalis DSM 15212]